MKLPQSPKPSRSRKTPSRRRERLAGHQTKDFRALLHAATHRATDGLATRKGSAGTGVGAHRSSQVHATPEFSRDVTLVEGTGSAAVGRRSISARKESAAATESSDAPDGASPIELAAYLDSQGFLPAPVLVPPAGIVAAPTPSSGQQYAETAALVDRLLRSVQVGRTQGGHEVRLHLADRDIEVRLRHVDGVLQPTLSGEGDLSAFASRIDEELRSRGLRFDRVRFG